MTTHDRDIDEDVEKKNEEMSMIMTTHDRDNDEDGDEDVEKKRMRK